MQLEFVFCSGFWFDLVWQGKRKKNADDIFLLILPKSYQLFLIMCILSGGIRQGEK